MSKVDQQGEVWETVTSILREQLTESAWFSTFQDASPVDDLGDSLLIEVPNNLAKERILSRYRSMLDDALVDAHHQPVVIAEYGRDGRLRRRRQRRASPELFAAKATSPATREGEPLLMTCSCRCRKRSPKR